MSDVKPFEVISVDRMEIQCDGGGGPLGHPRVYLHIDQASAEVLCPYCSRLYVHKNLKSA
ncbi:MAG: zinc-finger domain-containing protein [Rickettsiales bacterium]|nr:zinc-finger domain-containing protein [Rickettsiales bacterium]